MKEFTPDFFYVDNFIISKKIYNKDNITARKCMHICYNVNDAYIPIMGASIVSVLENNKNANIIFHIFTDAALYNF